MQNETSPAFPPQWQPLVDDAAQALRRLALNEEAKARFCRDPQLRTFMHRVTRRYVAGVSVSEAIERVADTNLRGHRASADYMGESCRDEGTANAATDVFLELNDSLDRRKLDCSISLDLSHIGSLVDPELGYQNASRIAAAAAASSREVMISIEGSDRVDNVYATYARLHTDAGRSNVGITVPARLHRTDEDLPKLLGHTGRVRLTKGAYAEPEHIACARNGPELATRYLRFAKVLITSGCKCSIATHDRSLIEEISAMIAARNIGEQQYEFESLLGLGTAQIDELRGQGHPTREYAVFGEEHFLYALNRIAEEPIRVYQALSDLLCSA